MKTIDLKIHLDKIEVVLRNKSVLCGWQVGGMGRIENSGRVMQLILQSGLKLLWFY